MKRILIADDDADLRDVLLFALQDRFRVTLAANGIEAIRKLERQAFDAVLLDLSMPLLDGCGVIREIRRRRLQVPILILSAEPDLPTIAAQLDVRDFLAKPVSLEDLRGALRRLTSSSAAPRTARLPERV